MARVWLQVPGVEATSSLQLPDQRLLVALEAVVDDAQRAEARIRDRPGSVQILGECHDRGRVEPAAQRRGNRAIGSKPRRHALAEDRREVLDVRLRAAVAHRRRRLERPEAPPLDAIRGYAQQLTRQYRADALVIGRRQLLRVLRQVDRRQRFADALVVRFHRNVRPLQQLMDVRRHGEAVPVDAVVQRPLAAAVPGADQPLLPWVPDHDREVAEQHARRVQPPALVGAQDQLRVADVRRWHVAQPSQQLGAVVESSVGHDRAAGPRAPQRFDGEAIGWRRDQPGVAKDRWPEPSHSRPVQASVRDCLQHGHDFHRRGSPPRPRQHGCHATHRSNSRSARID